MTTKLFKTKKLAEQYIRENYSGSHTEPRDLSNTANWEDVDMPNLQWSGETPGLSILDKDLNEIDRVAWWEDGDDKYELYIGGNLAREFDNIYDAREALKEAVQNEQHKDDEEEEVFEIKLFCDGEDITN